MFFLSIRKTQYAGDTILSCFVLFSATGNVPSRPICIKLAAKAPIGTRLYFLKSVSPRFATVGAKALLMVTPST